MDYRQFQAGMPPPVTVSLPILPCHRNSTEGLPLMLADAITNGDVNLLVLVLIILLIIAVFMWIVRH